MLMEASKSNAEFAQAGTCSLHAAPTVHQILTPPLPPFAPTENLPPRKPDPRKWSIAQVADWMSSELEMPQHAAVVHQLSISGRDLLKLTDLVRVAL